MERRNHNRLPVRLNAVVHDKMYRTWDFIIENFGFDGLQLICHDNQIMPDSIHVNDLLDIQFDIVQFDIVQFDTERQGENQTFHLEVSVVRIHESKLAVSLFNPALDAITKLSNKQQRDGTLNESSLANTLNKQSQNILQAIKQCFLKNISHATEIFLPIAHDAFFQKAQQSDNNNEQAIFFDAINTLNKSKDNLKAQFLSQMENNLNNCGSQRTENKQLGSDESDELDLIDQNEFENWLTVNQLIIETSTPYEQQLLEIQLRLAEFFAVDKAKIQKIPFSPEVIFNEFSRVIHQYFLNNDVLLILYKQFEKTINNHLADIYNEINQIFIDNNILPIIDKKKYEIKRETSIDNKKNQLADKEQASLNNQVPKETQVKPSLLAQNNTQLMNTFQHQTELNTIENNVNLVPTYQTLKDLLTFQNGQAVVKTSNDFFLSDAYRTQLSLLINDLTLIQKKQAKTLKKNGIAAIDLSNLVQQCMDKDSYSLEIKNEFEYTLDIIKRLFISIGEDAWLGEPVKKLLLQLQIPLLKVSLLHKDFFESWSNPARMMINKLAMVDFDDEKNHFYIKARSFVIYLLSHFDEDLEVFTKVQKVLSELLEIQAAHYNKKVNKIIDNWTAQQMVTNELASRLAGRTIPIVIANFISYQWLPVLVSTYSNHGKESTQWSQYLQALDMLILSVSGDVSDEFIESDVILFIIKQGLEESGQHNKKVLDDIQSFLTQKKSKNVIRLNHDIITKLLINGYALSDKTAIQKINKGITDAMALANNAIAKRLKINDYLVFKQSKKSKRIQLIWQSDNQNVFVFAGRNGQQDAVFNRMEVIEMLDNGQLAQTKDYDLPLLERSLYAIMGGVHDDIAKQSNIDKLTGLIKQKEFIRLFNERLKQKTGLAYDCFLCLIDIDQFSLINDTCGYEAGDQYIAEISQLLIKNLNSDVIVGRYGVDEFILLLPECSTEKSLEISALQRKLIYAYNFKWEDKEFTLSASIGMVAVSEANEPGIFLKAVVTAATIAKEMGRNRVHFLEYDALELNYRQELQLWATRIDQMVKNNQLNIRCQRLHPLLEQSAVQHYEMLLLVNDNNGSYMPPGEFIEAAELYNKMNDVDRWVINYVFDWFSKNPEQLDIMGGIAINLSGQSLNDVDFLSFIKDTFAQYPDIPHDKICFEITETMAITNMNYANNVIHAIKEMGCEFSLDDFGTGQSSYAYLKNLPVDYLKIDGVFIKDIVNNPADQAMVKSINEIGHFLGMKTVAEYVENDEIIAILKDIGVDYAQGFGIEKPLLISEYMEKSTFLA